MSFCVPRLRQFAQGLIKTPHSSGAVITFNEESTLYCVVVASTRNVGPMRFGRDLGLVKNVQLKEKKMFVDI